MLSSIFGKVAGAFFEKLLGKVLEAWKQMTRDQMNIDLGATKANQGRVEDEAARAKRAKEVGDEVRDLDDAALDDGMRKPESRSNGN